MYRKVLVSFLKAIVLADVVKVVASDHDRPLHFHLQHDAGQDTSTNAHVAGEWTFLVNIVTLDSLNNTNKCRMHSMSIFRNKSNVKLYYMSV